MARLGFCGACPTETETSRREASFPRVFCAYKPICMDCTLLHNGGRSTVWYAYPKEERAVILRDPLLFTLPPHGGLLIGGPGNGAPPPSKSSPYAIIYNPRAEMKHIPKVYDAALLNDRLKELIRAVIFVSINHGCFAKLGPLQGFNFFTSIH